MEKSCGEVPGGSSRSGVPTPSITRETSACTGAMSVSTAGGSAKAGRAIRANGIVSAVDRRSMADLLCEEFGVSILTTL